MAFLADEIITVAVGATKTLSSDLINQNGSSRAQHAIIWNHAVDGTPTVALRFLNAPDVDLKKFRPIQGGQEANVYDYDNLRDLILVGIGDADATLFVQYFN